MNIPAFFIGAGVAALVGLVGWYVAWRIVVSEERERRRAKDAKA